jgi:hypothetical protein
MEMVEWKKRSGRFEEGEIRKVCLRIDCTKMKRKKEKFKCR